MEETNLTVPFPLGFAEVAGQLGYVIEVSPDGVFTRAEDKIAVEALFASWNGSTEQLNWYKEQKQADLDTLLDEEFDLKAFIRGGSATGLTGNQVGNFLANITNNYRSKRATINSSTTVAQVQSVNVNTGWPSNP